MTIDLTDEDLAALERLFTSSATTEREDLLVRAAVVRGYRAGLAAGRARAIEECQPVIDAAKAMRADPTYRINAARERP